MCEGEKQTQKVARGAFTYTTTQTPVESSSSIFSDRLQTDRPAQVQLKVTDAKKTTMVFKIGKIGRKTIVSGARRERDEC